MRIFGIKWLDVLIENVRSAAVAISLFGTISPAALATIVVGLTEVPVMLILVKIANRTQHWFPKTAQ